LDSINQIDAVISLFREMEEIVIAGEGGMGVYFQKV